MKIKNIILAGILGAGIQFQAAAEQINGAGSSFIYPIFSQWASTYYQNTNEKINYQSIGSGGGIRQIIQGTVDFAATDAPLTQDELSENTLLQYPLIMGGVIPTHNIPGIKANELRLDGETLAQIFSGKISHWNDPKIQKLNPDLKIPKKAITIVHRADGSGSTWMFTNYLSKVSKDWADTIGSDKSVNWPKGVGAKGNEGVANYIKRIEGSIGYIELAYVLHNNMSSVKIKNKEGNYVAPTLESLKAAAASADWDSTPGMAVILTDQPGAESWPITGATFVLMPEPVDSVNNQKLQKFLNWSWRDGAEKAAELAYVPLPLSLVKKIEANWQKK